uniref:Uncharacterized protein n=1 Tax=Rhizophora mucronata TaxID=61149 RepID=A0A2P2NV64_RHIMU
MEFTFLVYVKQIYF